MSAQIEKHTKPSYRRPFHKWIKKGEVFRIAQFEFIPPKRFSGFWVLLKDSSLVI